MQKTDSEHIDAFLDYANKFSGAWQSLDLRAGMVPHEGQDYIFALSATLDPRSVDRLPASPGDASAGLLKTRRLTYSSEQLAELFSQLRMGFLNIEGKQCILGKPLNKGEAQSIGIHTSLKEGGLARFRPEKGHASIVCERYETVLGNATGNILHNESMLDRALRALPTPYESYAAVVREYFGRNESHMTGDTKGFFVLRGDIPLHFGQDLRWEKNSRVLGSVQLREQLDPGKVSVGYTLKKRDSDPVRQKITWTEEKWIAKDNGHVATFEVECGPYEECELYLRYGVESLVVKRVRNADYLPENPALLSHRHFDQDFELFNKWIAGGIKNAKNFEMAIGWLFHFAGFQTAPYGGGNSIKNEVDQLCIWSLGKVALAVECTTDSTELSKKMKKLLHRTDDLINALPGWDVFPVLATSLPHEKIADSERRDAGTDFVVLLAAPELSAIMGATRSGAGPGEIVELLSKGGLAASATPQPHIFGSVSSMRSFARRK